MSVELKKTHLKARIEKGQGYPDRLPVANGVTWATIDLSSYNPADFTSPVVLQNDRSLDPQNPKLWADPIDPSLSKNAPQFFSYEGHISLDSRGRPLNPIGPTGLEGRGLLGNWGPNFAADSIVTRINDQGFLEVVVIKRRDNGQWAIPGGMVDQGERITATLKRELGEETSAILDFESAPMVYQGYVDDPRNTDNAWMETVACHLHLDSDTPITLDAKDDASDARWMVLSAQEINSLYASHAKTVSLAIALWQEKNHQIVDQDGFIRDPVL